MQTCFRWQITYVLSGHIYVLLYLLWRYRKNKKKKNRRRNIHKKSATSQTFPKGYKMQGKSRCAKFSPWKMAHLMELHSLFKAVRVCEIFWILITFERFQRSCGHCMICLGYLWENQHSTVIAHFHWYPQISVVVSLFCYALKVPNFVRRIKFGFV